ncbi:Rha family transcriptional regulator [Herbaspirillum autotrophicum]|uniref:Rha family transcriptional regulator n=1 Tax=Herbaspirillum autotrophicum TaxID=180195 RepID=UPI0012EE7D8E|nr:Rha family transcriptional regulator [Herbaspirillum autotrophicum]
MRVADTSGGLAGMAGDGLIFDVDGAVVTSSRQVARCFGRSHKEVMLEIELLTVELPECWYQHNFLRQPMTARGVAGYCYITRDGFMLLTMKFTGRNTSRLQLAYLEQFHLRELQCGKHRTALSDRLSRAPLTAALRMLVERTEGVNLSQAYRLLHQRFAVTSVAHIAAEHIPLAIEYIHRLMLSREAPGGDPQRWKAAFGNPPESHTAALCRHMLWISAWWKVHRRSIRRLYREAAAGIEDDVIDGAAIARQLAVEAGLRFPYDYASSYPWCGATREHGICAQR